MASPPPPLHTSSWMPSAVLQPLWGQLRPTCWYAFSPNVLSLLKDSEIDPEQRRHTQNSMPDLHTLSVVGWQQEQWLANSGGADIPGREAAGSHARRGASAGRDSGLQPKRPGSGTVPHIRRQRQEAAGCERRPSYHCMHSPCLMLESRRIHPDLFGCGDTNCTICGHKMRPRSLPLSCPAVDQLPSQCNASARAPGDCDWLLCR